MFRGSDAANAIVETRLYFITKKSKFCLQKGLSRVKVTSLNVSAKMREHSRTVFTKRAVIGVLTEARDGA